MSKIKVRLLKRGTVNVKLKPQNGIKAKTDTTYLYDPTLVAGWVDLAEDWAIKTDGKVEEEGVEIDYSAKAYAIGGTGTQTNNAKYYAEQASNSATSASNSANTATTQAGIATTQAGISTTQAGLASGYATSASNSASSASTSASNSQIWAEGTDVQVSALGGTHSAKEWANIVSTSLDDYTKTSDLADVALSNSYNDLDDKPTIGNATLTIQRNSTTVDTFTANSTTNKTINITVPTSASDVNALPSSTKYGASLSLSINNTTYVVTAQLKDQDGNNLGTTQTIDLPLESVVVSGSYDSANKKIVLTLQSGSTIDVPVGDLIAGLQTEITSSNKLDADLVDDSTSTNKFVTASDKTTWNGKQDAISDLATIRSGASAGATALQSGDDVSELNNDAGYITGITSTDVTTALGYTPYNSSNPNGYTSNVGTVTSVNSTSPDANGNVSISVGDTLPSQTGNNGKFLTTDGSATSWATVDALPSQTGQSGKYLTTDGSSASWATVDSLPTQTGNSGKFLTTNGTTASWGTATKVTIRRFS